MYSGGQSRGEHHMHTGVPHICTTCMCAQTHANTTHEIKIREEAGSQQPSCSTAWPETWTVGSAVVGSESDAWLLCCLLCEPWLSLKPLYVARIVTNLGLGTSKHGTLRLQREAWKDLLKTLMLGRSHRSEKRTPASSGWSFRANGGYLKIQ